MPRTTQFRLVLVTCGSLTESHKIARAVVAKRLAACVNIVTAPVESLYNWKGKLERSREHLLLIKTNVKRLEALEREVLRLHSYEIPEFLVLPIAAGSKAYLRWLANNSRGPERRTPCFQELHIKQRLIQIGNNIFHILDANAQTNQTIRDPHPVPHFLWHGRVRHLRG